MDIKVLLLLKVLKQLPLPQDPRILVGPETSDDAAVFKISEVSFGCYESISAWVTLQDDLLFLTSLCSLFLSLGDSIGDHNRFLYSSR